MESNLKKIIIAILVFIIIIVLLIFIILNKQKNIDNNFTIQGDPGIIEDFENEEIKIVTEKIDYYTVRNCINTYLNSLNEKSSTYYIENEFDKGLQKEYIYSLLSSEYIQDKKISIENVLENISIFNESRIFIPIEMRVLEKKDINKFLVYGVVQNVDYEYINSMYIIVNLDFKNKTFSIEPIDDDYDNIDQISIINNNILIDCNDYNKYIEQKITNEYITNEYMLLYKRLAFSNPNILYEFLDEDYRDKRFGSLQNFKDYINDNNEQISKIRLSQYLVNNNDEYIEYVAKDQYENIYIFNEYYDIGKIKIKLDTYTIVTEKFINEYKNASEEKKVQMNIDKFIQMINRHDYKSSYNCIADSFKNNYFNSQEEFENYIINNFFSYNKFEFKGFEKKGSNVYVYNIDLIDLTGESKENKNIDIIMRLNDNMDFEMSFGM